MLGNNSNGELIYSLFFFWVQSLLLLRFQLFVNRRKMFFFFFGESRLKMLYENININRINRGELMLEVIVKI